MTQLFFEPQRPAINNNDVFIDNPGGGNCGLYSFAVYLMLVPPEQRTPEINALFLDTNGQLWQFLSDELQKNKGLKRIGHIYEPLQAELRTYLKTILLEQTNAALGLDEKNIKDLYIYKQFSYLIQDSAQYALLSKSSKLRRVASKARKLIDDSNDYNGIAEFLIPSLFKYYREEIYNSLNAYESNWWVNEEELSLLSKSFGIRPNFFASGQRQMLDGVDNEMQHAIENLNNTHWVVRRYMPQNALFDAKPNTQAQPIRTELKSSEPKKWNSLFDDDALFDPNPKRAKVIKEELKSSEPKKWNSLFDDDALFDAKPNTQAQPKRDEFNASDPDKLQESITRISEWFENKQKENIENKDKLAQEARRWQQVSSSVHPFPHSWYMQEDESHRQKLLQVLECYVQEKLKDDALSAQRRELLAKLVSRAEDIPTPGVINHMMGQYSASTGIIPRKYHPIINNAKTVLGCDILPMRDNPVKWKEFKNLIDAVSTLNNESPTILHWIKDQLIIHANSPNLEDVVDFLHKWKMCFDDYTQDNINKLIPDTWYQIEDRAHNLKLRAILECNLRMHKMSHLCQEKLRRSENEGYSAWIQATLDWANDKKAILQRLLDSEQVPDFEMCHQILEDIGNKKIHFTDVFKNCEALILKEIDTAPSGIMSLINFSKNKPIDNNNNDDDQDDNLQNHNFKLWACALAAPITDVLIYAIPGAFDFLSKALLITSPVGLYLLMAVMAVLVTMAIFKFFELFEDDVETENNHLVF